MRISIADDFGRMASDLSDVVKKQIPFATARALTRTAQQGVLDVKAKAVKELDRPTPFTLRGFTSLPAKKFDLQSHVFIKSIQADYLKYAIDGGTRQGNRSSPVLVPGKNLRLNRYGNIGRNRLRGKSTSKVFVTDEGVVYERLRDSIRTLALYRGKAEYEKRLTYYETLKATVARTFPIEMDKSLEDALRTAR